MATITDTFDFTDTFDYPTIDDECTLVKNYSPSALINIVQEKSGRMIDPNLSEEMVAYSLRPPCVPHLGVDRQSHVPLKTQFPEGAVSRQGIILRDREGLVIEIENYHAPPSCERFSADVPIGPRSRKAGIVGSVSYNGANVLDGAQIVSKVVGAVREYHDALVLGRQKGLIRDTTL